MALPHKSGYPSHTRLNTPCKGLRRNHESCVGIDRGFDLSIVTDVVSKSENLEHIKFGIPNMRAVSCQGSPHEIGLQHGQQAISEIKGSLEFYAELFRERCSMEWPAVCEVAAKFVPFLQDAVPWYMDEIRGVAQGAGVDVESIVAINVRTEIAYGMFSDGCTALSWKDGGKSFLAQNWDWASEQSPNLVSMHIRPADSSKPSIHMITEGGIIGKIGLNSHGVGVMLNAVKAAGVNFGKLPCHLALRAVLDSASRVDAVQHLEKLGVASSCHITVGDGTGGTGLECSANDIVQLNMGDSVEPRPGVVTHSNHYVHKHRDAESILYLPDSVDRLERIRQLVAQTTGKASRERLEEMMKDEQGFPEAICRQVTEKSSTATLFGIIMDLGEKTATVKLGRPVEPTGIVVLKP